MLLPHDAADALKRNAASEKGKGENRSYSAPYWQKGGPLRIIGFLLLAASKPC